MAPAARAATTSSFSEISPPAIIGTLAMRLTRVMILGISPGRISRVSGLATAICFWIFSKAMESRIKIRRVVNSFSSFPRLIRAGLVEMMPSAWCYCE